MTRILTTAERQEIERRARMENTLCGLIALSNSDIPDLLATCADLERQLAERDAEIERLKG